MRPRKPNVTPEGLAAAHAFIRAQLRPPEFPPKSIMTRKMKDEAFRERRRAFVEQRRQQQQETE